MGLRTLALVAVLLTPVAASAHTSTGHGLNRVCLGLQMRFKHAHAPDPLKSKHKNRALAKDLQLLVRVQRAEISGFQRVKPAMGERRLLHGVLANLRVSTRLQARVVPLVRHGRFRKAEALDTRSDHRLRQLNEAYRRVDAPTCVARVVPLKRIVELIEG